MTDHDHHDHDHEHHDHEHDHHDHEHGDHERRGPVEGKIAFEHEGKHYKFPGEAVPFIGHDGDSAVKLEDSAELLTIHLDKSDPPTVMHVHPADMSEEEILEAGGKIWEASLIR